MTEPSSLNPLYVFLATIGVTLGLCAFFIIMRYAINFFHWHRGLKRLAAINKKVQDINQKIQEINGTPKESDDKNELTGNTGQLPEEDKKQSTN